MNKVTLYEYSAAGLCKPEQFIGIATSLENAEKELSKIFPGVKFYKTFNGVREYITDNCDILFVSEATLEFEGDAMPTEIWITKTGRLDKPDKLEACAVTFEKAYSKAMSKHPYMHEKKSWRNGYLYSDTTKAPTVFISIERTNI